MTKIRLDSNMQWLIDEEINAYQSDREKTSRRDTRLKAKGNVINIFPTRDRVSMGLSGGPLVRHYVYVYVRVHNRGGWVTTGWPAQCTPVSTHGTFALQKGRTWDIYEYIYRKKAQWATRCAQAFNSFALSFSPYYRLSLFFGVK